MEAFSQLRVPSQITPACLRLTKNLSSTAYCYRKDHNHFSLVFALCFYHFYHTFSQHHLKIVFLQCTFLHHLFLLLLQLIYFPNVGSYYRKLAQQLNAPTVLPEGPSSLPTCTLEKLTTSRDLPSSSSICEHCIMCV